MSLSQILTKFSKNTARNVSVYTIESPVGKIIGAADDNYLYIVLFEDSKNLEKSFQTLCDKLSCSLIEIKNNILIQIENELQEYFLGNLKKFSVPIMMFGSDFQQSVWKKLQELPYASTQTYGDLAKALGREASHARAIGAACGANPHLIITPCHRLIASGSKGGFSCGLDRKEWLISHEAKNNGRLPYIKIFELYKFQKNIKMLSVGP